VLTLVTLAISTLLQAPIVRTGLLPHTSAPASSLHKPPSSRDIPPVTLTNIPHVEPSAFKPYLSQVGNLFAARQRVEAEETASPQWTRRERAGSRDEDVAGYFDGAILGDRPSRPGSRGSISGASPVEPPPLGRRRSSGQARRTQLAVAPLSSIPHVYFEESFRLENPRTFDVVTERSEVIRTPQPIEDAKAANGIANGSAIAPRKALATNAILQEKLSWYLDTVEIHLISSISAASKSFFAALGSLKELHSEAADSVSKIQKLREDLSQLDKDMAIGRLEIVRLRQRRQNLSKLGDATVQLHNVIKGASYCEELVDQGNLEKSLDHIGTLERYTCGFIEPDAAKDQSWLCPESPHNLIDLRKLRAFEGFGDGMNQLRSRIGAGFQSRFMEALLGDLRQHFGSVPNKDTLRRWASASQRSRGLQISTPATAPAYLNSSAELRQSLAGTLVGLKRSRFTATATTTFREAVTKEMKYIIRHNLPSSSDDDDSLSVASSSTRSSRAPLTQEAKSRTLARNLQALGPDDAEEVFTKTYCAVGEALRRLQVQIKLLLDVSSDASMSPTRGMSRSNTMGSLDRALSPPPVTRSPSPNLQQELVDALDLSSLLGQAVDAAHTQIVKVLKVRGEQVTRYSLPQIIRYYTLNRLFIDECEAVSFRSGDTLKRVIDYQIQQFITTFADAERQNLAQRMEADKWDAKDFGDSDSADLNKILEGMTSDPPSYLRPAYIWEDDQLNGTSSNGAVIDSRNPRPAIIDEEKFILADSAIHLLHSITRFQTFIACIPLKVAAAEISAALLDHLKLFNSLSCQLVLGAGATRSSAALRNINTKHLALASQALSFVIALIPYIREFVRRRPAMTGSDVLIEFDKVKRLFQDHQASVHEKLVDIMASRAGAHVRTFLETDMDADAGREGASPCMETMAKETTMLHRALSKHMPEINVKIIMEPVWRSYEEQWGKAFREKSVNTEEGKKR
jgi:vacuolar protein sorting-associated protein 54